MLTKEEAKELGNSISSWLQNNPPEDPVIRDILRNQLALVETLNGVWQQQEHEEQKPLLQEPINKNMAKNKLGIATVVVAGLIAAIGIATAVWATLTWGSQIQGGPINVGPEPFQPPINSQNY